MKWIAVVSLLVASSAPVFASCAQQGAWTERAIYDFSAKRWTAVAAYQIEVFPHAFGTSHSLDVVGFSGTAAAGQATIGFGIETSFKVADNLRLIIGLASRFSPDRQPSFAGLEIGVSTGF